MANPYRDESGKFASPAEADEKAVKKSNNNSVLARWAKPAWAGPLLSDQIRRAQDV
jgi:hypothetical protein